MTPYLDGGEVGGRCACGVEGVIGEEDVVNEVVDGEMGLEDPVGGTRT